jgi:hypothetical protein
LPVKALAGSQRVQAAETDEIEMGCVGDDR